MMINIAHSDLPQSLRSYGQELYRGATALKRGVLHYGRGICKEMTVAGMTMSVAGEGASMNRPDHQFFKRKSTICISVEFVEDSRLLTLFDQI